MKTMKKTKHMLEIENKHGEKLEELIRRLYVDEKLSTLQMAERIGISYVTVIKWVKLAGVYSRRLETLNKD